MSVENDRSAKQFVFVAVFLEKNFKLKNIAVPGDCPFPPPKYGPGYDITQGVFWRCSFEHVTRSLVWQTNWDAAIVCRTNSPYRRTTRTDNKHIVRAIYCVP